MLSTKDLILKGIKKHFEQWEMDTIMTPLQVENLIEIEGLIHHCEVREHNSFTSQTIRYFDKQTGVLYMVDMSYEHYYDDTYYKCMTYRLINRISVHLVKERIY